MITKDVTDNIYQAGITRDCKCSSIYKQEQDLDTAGRSDLLTDNLCKKYTTVTLK